MNQNKLKVLINLLKRTPKIISELVGAIPDSLINSNEGVNTWSPYDVVGHLIHGEKTDWIPRTKNILEFGDSKPFVPFDRFAQEKDSAGKSIEDLLKEFTELRLKNVTELEQMNLKDEDFNKTGVHPEFGTVMLSQLLTTWAVHDLNHISQISRVTAHQFDAEVGPWKNYLRILNY